LKHELLIIAGETSGDLHGASLIRELKKLDKDISVFGIGGNKMKAEGMETIYHINQVSFLGFVEVLKHIPFMQKVKAQLVIEALKREIKTAVLIDYPGFNLQIAKELKPHGIHLVYFISPQVWAWGAGRIHKIKKLINKMLVILPFEEKLFSDAGIDTEFIGHPLLEQISNYNFLSKEELFAKYNLDSNKEILLVLPGSRRQEVKMLFPTVINAAEKLAAEFNFQTVVACSEDIDEKVFGELSSASNYKLIKGNTYDLLKYSRFGIIKSGTSTLEAGLFELPMVIVYKTNNLTFEIGKRVVKLDRIGLVNIVLNEMVVPELLQKDAGTDSIIKTCREILSSKEKYNSIKEKLGKLKDNLGTQGASKRAAESVFKMMNNEAE
jgi:lipid-A-disaccharide synthase